MISDSENLYDLTDLGMIDEDAILKVIADVGCQTADTFSWMDLQQIVIKYLRDNTRPGCNCDYSCTDEDCEAAETDFDHWRQ